MTLTSKFFKKLHSSIIFPCLMSERAMSRALAFLLPATARVSGFAAWPRLASFHCQLGQLIEYLFLLGNPGSDKVPHPFRTCGDRDSSR